VQKYRLEWEKDYPWLEYLRENEYKANCTICSRVFSVCHGGVYDVKQHASGDNPQEGAILRFLVRQTSPEAGMVVIRNYGK